jgi:hypothetical protein
MIFNVIFGSNFNYFFAIILSDKLRRELLTEKLGRELLIKCVANL